MKNILKHSDHLIDLALAEDFGQNGDITTLATIPEDKEGEAVLYAKADGVICGLEIFERVFLKLNEQIMTEVYVKDGDRIKKGDKVLLLKGNLRAILMGERTALNFIQRLSGIASFSAELADLVAGTTTKILDTRKTLPGFRQLDKYAVKTGGADNHRIGLYDMFMIKDNHIEGAGSITEAVKRVKEYRAQANLSVKIEVEVKNIAELNEALTAVVDVIMLDNMNNQLIAECVKINNGKSKLEVSGNVTAERVKELVNIGVDYISLGALTHSVKAFDLSLLVKSS
jgi:nicotinate-nucleotide pyrophosphorylase (carboxylating)